MRDYSFVRGRLPGDQAYPLTRTALDSALESAGVTSLRHVHFGRHQRDGEVLRATFVGESTGHSGEPQRFIARAGTTEFTLYSVTLANRAQIERMLLRARGNR